MLFGLVPEWKNAMFQWFIEQKPERLFNFAPPGAAPAEYGPPPAIVFQPAPEGADATTRSWLELVRAAACQLPGRCPGNITTAWTVDMALMRAAAVFRYYQRALAELPGADAVLEDAGFAGTLPEYVVCRPDT